VGYSRACRNTQELVWVVAVRISQRSGCWWWLNGRSVSGPCAAGRSRTVGTGIEQQMAHVNNGHLGLCSRPHLLPHCDRAQNRGVMANGEVQRPIRNI